MAGIRPDAGGKQGYQSPGGLSRGSGDGVGTGKWDTGGFRGTWCLDGGEGERGGFSSVGDGSTCRFRGYRKRSRSGVGVGDEKLTSLTINQAPGATKPI